MASLPNTRPGFASHGCYVDASAPTASWLHHAARTVARRYGRSLGSMEHEDLVQEGYAAWYAAVDMPRERRYVLAERAMERLAAGDQIVTGESHAIAPLRRVTLEHARERASATPAPPRRLARGDREALRTFLGRTLTHPTRRSRPTAYLLMTGLLCEGESLALMAHRLGISLPSAMSMRAIAAAKCRRALASTHPALTHLP